MSERPVEEVVTEEAKSVKAAKKPRKAPAKKANREPDVVSKNDSSSKANKPNQFQIPTRPEPETRIVKGIDVKFSIDDLQEKGTSSWDGQYHEVNEGRGYSIILSFNCKVPGIAGVCRVVKEAYEDYTAFDEKHPYFDEKSDKAKPRWFMVDVEFVRKFQRFLPLKLLQQQEELKEMSLIKRGRLSVQRVTEEDYNYIIKLEEKRRIEGPHTKSTGRKIFSYTPVDMPVIPFFA
ncbi:PUA-like domain-containing protein [Chytridium lagenaria]|nr:PUA-like domain-containing protein [Chytridium lagenaria]